MVMADPNTTQQPEAPPAAESPTGAPTLDARGVSHRFGEKQVLESVDLAVRPGQIHALLGPNGAGKTTLVRVLAGLLTPTVGSVTVAGFDPRSNPRLFRQRVGLVPSGDRTFYLRISALENLVFYARLHGLGRRDAQRRAQEVLAAVGLEESRKQPVSQLSHGMQKRLSVARALLMSPPILLVDEATHDLDPEGARRIRDLVATEVARGAAAVWVTQRVDEIRGLADLVTVLSGGRVRFAGSVPQLLAHAEPRRFLLHLAGAGIDRRDFGALLGSLAGLEPVAEDPAHWVLELADEVVLGDALAALTAAGVQVLSCREERSEIEEAFVLLTDGQSGA
jgi:ABC-2 type transport system ATP-binding protein